MINQEEIRARQKRMRPFLIVIVIFMVAISVGYGYIHRNDLKNSMVSTFNAVPAGVLLRYDFAPELIPLLETGSSAPYSFYLGSGVGFPPMGLKLDMNGVLKGTPTGTGTSKFEVCVKDVGGRSACRTYSMPVAPKTTALKTVPNTNSVSNGGQNTNIVQGTKRTEKWEGTFTNHEVFDNGAWVCTTDTTAPVSICMTWQGKNFSGITNYPEGFKDTYTNDPNDICPHVPHCPGQCGGDQNMTGYIDSNGNLKFDWLSLVGGLSYHPNSPGGEFGTITSAVMTGNSMTVEFNSVLSGGTHVTSSNKGGFTATKVSDSCK